MHQSPTRSGNSTTLLHSASYAGQAPMTVMAPAPPLSWSGTQNPQRFQSFSAAPSFVPAATPSFVPSLAGHSAPYAQHFASPRLSMAPVQNAMRGPFQATPYNASGISQAPKPECKDPECVEEECDPQECGDETRGPSDDNLVCGIIDKRPLLPVGFAGLVLGGAAFTVLLEFPLIEEVFQHARPLEHVLLALFAVTLGCMACCAFLDPGQLKRDQCQASPTLAQHADPDCSDDTRSLADSDLPARAHQTWMYARPIRRYDHYCRWLMNCIGLLNHREFVLMLCCLVSISLLGSLVDAAIAVHLARQGGSHSLACSVAVHACVLLTLGYYVLPIWKLHVGLVSRNELAHEWKRNAFYVVKCPKSGHMVPVSELHDDDYNELVDHSLYDKSKNSFDHGWTTNCQTFWCASRWDPHQTGAF